MNGKRHLGWAAVAAAAALGACSSHDDETPAPPASTSSAFVAYVKALATADNTEPNDVGAVVPDTPETAEPETVS